VPQARVSSATFYKWKAKFGGFDISDAKWLQALKDEQLKKLLAEAMLDKRSAQGHRHKKGNARRQARGRRSALRHV